MNLGGFRLVISVQTGLEVGVMGLAVATTTDEARAHNRFQVKGWGKLLTDFSNHRLNTVWARANNIRREEMMVK